MKIIYEKPLDRQIWDVVQRAKKDGLKIERIELSEAEMRRIRGTSGHSVGTLYDLLGGIPVKVVPEPGEITPCDKYWRPMWYV